MKKQDYTYTIKQIDIPNSNILIVYKPKNSKLNIIEWNICAYNQHENGELMSIDECIEFSAPHALWNAQETLIEKYDELINSSKEVIF